MISALLEAGFEWLIATSLTITRFYWYSHTYCLLGLHAALRSRPLVATYHLTYSLYHLFRSVGPLLGALLFWEEF